MIPSNYIELIKRLQEKTKSKEVIWQKTSRDDEYKLDLDKGAITIDKWNPEQKYYLSVDLVMYNDKGDKIDRILANDDGSIEDFKILEQFHTEVRRAYYKVDETIKGIFAEINKDGVIGKEAEPDEILPF